MKSLLEARPNLSGALADVLRQQIVDGEHALGARLNEVELASELGVSRTPLREALSRLSSEGFVVVRPRRGFFVARLDAADVADLYRIRSILDPAALRLGGIPDAATLDRLERLNRRILGARGKPDRIIDLDDAWHRLLLSGCENRFLIELIEQYMARTRPYEYAYMRATANVDTVVREHQTILEALAAGDVGTAARRLERNMTSAIEPLEAWLHRASPESPAEGA